jgi:hypothetical protein
LKVIVSGLLVYGSMACQQASATSASLPAAPFNQKDERGVAIHVINSKAASVGGLFHLDTPHERLFRLRLWCFVAVLIGQNLLVKFELFAQPARFPSLRYCRSRLAGSCAMELPNDSGTPSRYEKERSDLSRLRRWL